MAWQTLADGLKRCALCDEEFRPPRSCKCPHDAARAPGDVRLGSMESMTAQAKALGMIDRLGLEKHVALRVRRADSEARAYLKLMRAAVERGDEQTGQKWAALAESARGRGDKTARYLHGIVADRERRADLERQERLAEQVTGRTTRAVA